MCYLIVYVMDIFCISVKRETYYKIYNVHNGRVSE